MAKLSMRERIEQGMSVEPETRSEQAKNAISFVFVVSVAGLFTVLVVLFIARLF